MSGLWKDFWHRYGRLGPASSWKNVETHMGSSPINSEDITALYLWHHLDLSCHSLARTLNEILDQKGCQFKVGCCIDDSETTVGTGIGIRIEFD